MRWRKAGQTSTTSPGNLGGHTDAGMRGVRPIGVSGNSGMPGSRGVARNLPCLQCGAVVTRLPSQIRGGVFCSRACMGEHQRKPITRDCRVCGVTYTDPVTAGNADAFACWKHRGILKNLTHTIATDKKRPASYRVSPTKMAADTRYRCRARPLDLDLTEFL